MPVFNPPLGLETTIPITSSDHDRFVHLSFTLAFEIGEDASGSWELWTDIPDVNDEGQLTTGPGEWRAVPFAPIQSIHEAVDNHDLDASNKEGLLITIPPAPLTAAPLPIDHTLVAEMVVPANIASYFYTHRRVTDSGETQWLGNGGDNGVVRVLEIESITKHIQRKEWKGVGIELREDQSPIVHQLPVDDSVKASLVLVESVPPVVKPIHQLLDSPKKSETHTPESLVIVSNDLRPVSIQRNSTTPVAAGLREHFDRHRSFSEILSDVCNDCQNIQVIKDSPEGIVAFVYRSKSDSPVAYLVAHNTLRREQKLFASLSAFGQNAQIPLAIRNISSKGQAVQHIPAESSEQIIIDGSSDTGSSVSILQIAQFVTLQGKDSSYLIAADHALTQSISEKPQESVEQVTTADNSVKQNQAVDQYLSTATSDTLEEAARVTESTPEISDVPELVTDDGESIDSSSDSAVSRPIKPVSFLSWLKRFFVGFWSWLFSPFGLKRLAGKVDEDQAGSGTVTPNERTHLLSSPQSSAATSSTAVSPYSSPEIGKVKAELAKIDYPEPPAITKHDSPVATRGQEHETAETKYEARFTFANAPFRFFFPPHTFNADRLSLEYKREGVTDWTAASVTAEVKDGLCDEVNVEVPAESTSEDDKRSWEARWSAL